MKTITAAYGTQASGDSNRPIELFDLFLDTTTLRFVNYTGNLTFFDLDGVSQTYTGIPVSREAYERSVDNPINSVVIGIANVDRAISAYLATTELRGRRVVVRKVFSDLLTSSGDAVVVFDGVMDTPAATEKIVSINAVDRIGTLNRQVPRRWYQLPCTLKFSDEACFYGMTSGDMYDTTRAVCGNNCSTTLLIASALTSGDNYWINGEIQMTSGTEALKKRKIIDSDQSGTSVTLDISLDTAPVNGDTFTVRRGCDKSHFRCSGDFLNDANFGGFDTIPEQMIIR